VHSLVRNVLCKRTQVFASERLDRLLIGKTSYHKKKRILSHAAKIKFKTRTNGIHFWKVDVFTSND